MLNIGVHYRQLCACTVSLVVGTALLAPSGYTQPEPARSADDFVDSIGVNTHLFYDDSVYYQKYNEIIKPKLLELGVRHIRDSGTHNLNGYLDRLKDLANQGIRSHLIFDPRNSTPQQAITLIKQLGPSVVESIEGPNEYENSGDPNWIGTERVYVQQLYQAIKGDSTTASLPVSGPTLTSASAVNSVGDLSSFVDYGAMHNYYSGRNPGTSGWGDQGYGSIGWNVQLAQKDTGGKSVISTETGYHNAVNSTSGNIGVPEDVAGRYMPRLFLEQFNDGVPRTWCYEFIDSYNDSNDPDVNFGLLRNDGSEKPAYVALKNMINFLKDPGPSFILGTLDYSLSGNLNNVHHTLLEKRDGTFYLILWQEVSSFDVNNKLNINVKSQELKLSLNEPIANVKIHWLNNSVTASNNLNQIDLSVSASPLIVEIEK